MEITFASSYRQLQATEKQFVDGYVSDLETAAVRAGERLSVTLTRPVRVTDARAQDMLERQIVRAAIAERVKDLTAERELSMHRVLKELQAIAFSSIAHYMDVVNGDPYFDLTKCTPEQLSAIASIEIEDNPRGGRKFKFKLHDKMAGLDKFMRFYGLLDADNPMARAETARPVNGAPQLPAGVSDEQAADTYARLING